MKDTLKILDNSFSHSILGYCSDFQKSGNFEWNRGPVSPSDNLVITDNFLNSNLPHSKKNIAWLIEPYCISPQNYEYVKNNLNKFDSILTHDKTLLDLDEKINFIPFGCCWIPSEFQNVYEKNKNISIISSDKKYTEGHILRHEVISRFRSKIDVYGRGYNPIDFKIDGIKDYRFSIVIENCKRDYWFTEKLIDCFVTGTIPIYWGCPSIGDFFNTNGMLIFDNIDDLELILNQCNEELYYSKLDEIKENFVKSQNYLLPDDFVYKHIKEKY